MPNKVFIHYFKIVILFLSLMPMSDAATTSAPDFELPTDTGKISLTALKNKVVYLDFWASWCTPCRKSFPWMNEMKRLYGQQGLVVVAVNLDKEHTLAKTFLQKIPAQFTVAYDPEGEVAEKYKVRGMPSSYIIDRDGKLIKTHLGFRQEDTSDLESLLRLSLEN